MKKYIFSLSGGKDSTIGLWIVVKNKYPLDIVLCNKMPFEEPEMYEHLKKLDDWLFKEKGMRITFIQNQKPIEPFMSEITKRGKHKGIIRGFPLKIAGFCWISRDWKIRPLEIFTKKYAKENDCLIHTYKGFAIDEKNRKRQIKIKNYLQNKKDFIGKNNESYPLVDFRFTEEMCRNKLKEIGFSCITHFEYNRSGCWFCPKASKEARLKAIWKYAWRIKKIEEWCKLSGREIYPDLMLNEIKLKINIKNKKNKLKTISFSFFLQLFSFFSDRTLLS